MNNPQYKLFVPDVEKWTRFYTLQAQGKLEPAFRLQRGGRWQTMRSVERCLELYDPEWKKSKENKTKDQPNLTMVSETQQIVEQAKARQAMDAKDTQKRQDSTARKKKRGPRFVL